MYLLTPVKQVHTNIEIKEAVPPYIIKLASSLQIPGTRKENGRNCIQFSYFTSTYRSLRYYLGILQNINKSFSNQLSFAVSLCINNIYSTFFYNVEYLTYKRKSDNAFSCN